MIADTGRGHGAPCAAAVDVVCVSMGLLALDSFLGNPAGPTVRRAFGLVLARQLQLSLTRHAGEVLRLEAAPCA